MANPISMEIGTGTVGELLVQLRLLQYGVQAAPPLKDSGNDLVGLKGFAIRCIQVKTSTGALPSWPPESKRYHLIALVKLVGTENTMRLDDSQVYLLSKDELGGVERSWQALEPFALNRWRVETLFAP